MYCYISFSFVCDTIGIKQRINCFTLFCAILYLLQWLYPWSVEPKGLIEYEIQIVSQSRVLLSAGDRDQIQRGAEGINEILGRLGSETRLVVLERTNSIALIFICMSLSAVVNLRHQWSSEELIYIVESLFTFLLAAGAYFRVERLIWTLTDYERCLEFFNYLEGKTDNVY